MKRLIYGGSQDKLKIWDTLKNYFQDAHHNLHMMVTTAVQGEYNAILKNVYYVHIKTTRQFRTIIAISRNILHTPYK